MLMCLCFINDCYSSLLIFVVFEFIFYIRIIMCKVEKCHRTIPHNQVPFLASEVAVGIKLY